MAKTDGAAAAAREARRAFAALLADAPALAAQLRDGYLDHVERFVALLLDANARINLTRVVAPADVARLHLLDAVAALPLLDAAIGGPVVDLGSGGGVPALPLALARPERAWTLVDSVAKKAVILRGFATALGLRAVEVLAERAETAGRDPRHREQYAVVTARAVAPLAVLAELALPLLHVGGSLLAWKGPLGEEDDELRHGRAAIGRLGGGELRLVDPGLAPLGGHRFVVVIKERRTPPPYPRRPGEPARHPLG
ncbi:MAG TPA: 16S rRNA (guanine(527)-N(7))-methyltransferase RsmG [Candidatus Dormibacteraeota bacterium]|nr:16S rRNA (guanine(527)-N(7))-methyltransferase RsmG [Candidatus Dormibacteraeota bacterium]